MARVALIAGTLRRMSCSRCLRDPRVKERGIGLEGRGRGRPLPGFRCMNASIKIRTLTPSLWAAIHHHWHSDLTPTVKQDSPHLIGATCEVDRDLVT
jgi:hypothetical protein